MQTDWEPLCFGVFSARVDEECVAESWLHVGARGWIGKWRDPGLGLVDGGQYNGSEGRAHMVLQCQ
jgi:hypothetical protein